MVYLRYIKFLNYYLYLNVQNSLIDSAAEHFQWFYRCFHLFYFQGFLRPFINLLMRNAPAPPIAHPANLLLSAKCAAPPPTAQPANTFLSRFTLNKKLPVNLITFFRYFLKIVSTKKIASPPIFICLKGCFCLFSDFSRHNITKFY